MPRPLVFVLMSQRSGTTALVHTLNAHPGAALGLERYKFCWPDWPGTYDASLFEAERFFALDERETNIRATERWDRYYARLQRKWGPDTLSGDKLQPISPEMVRGILATTPQARFLYPFRQLLPLASSYAVRARDPEDANWSADRGAMAGWEVWRRDNRTVLDMLEDPEFGPSILPVAYEDFFPGDPVTVASVLDHVGLDEDPAFTRAVEQNAARHEEVREKPLALTYDEVERLLPHAYDPTYLALRRHVPHEPREGEDEDAPPEVQVAQLRDRLDHVQGELDRLRSRRVVRAALTVADRAGRASRRLRDAVRR